MKHLSIELNDLPNEIIVFILRKLYDAEVLYSLIGVNKRLTKITHDSIFTSHLTLTYFSNDFPYPLPDSMLDRFCSQILHEIHHKIKWLTLESTSMQRILRATNYPNLYGLGLYGINVNEAISLFTDDITFTCIVKNQISSLIIDISQDKKQILTTNMNKIIFTRIFTMFTNLQYLDFGPSSIWYQRISFDMPFPTITCLNLLELHICVNYFSDLLYLLDGRFNKLHTLHVNIYHIKYSRSTINSGEKLPNLKCFSLYCDMRTLVYDELIVPFLHRMLNLEILDLHIKVDRYKGFINGNDLKENIINYMPQLNKFTFNIRVFNHISNKINLPSNEDIQYTFKDFKDNQIISCVNLFQEKQFRYCHIYSYPYKMKYYDNISNNFPGGLFKYVHKVSLYDEYPFEHEFFLRIQKSFPFMKELTVINAKPQKNKLYRKSKNDNQDLSIIKYPHLIRLNLFQAHDDYVEQFLVDTDMCLPNHVHLSVNYEVMKMVTENFTRNATRINCEKLRSLYLWGTCEITKHVKDYFPHTHIF
ncbi:unnamed protein product [Rotaria magnacalcarata]|uniref:F-box domain-containing protein n=1 Tax=Rotaria magnacalcarata TaxID=392030 RepID=A0A815J3H7_9BILA|nr:unnamed protein product [Rotaria magnacalcarata]CAF1594957.1 unnamed protein product [Rotaria magnacalcarata]CAF1934161.1 unnamed protein product [Rotaria magnacalcarata]CAF3753785.1 unnamed protein product [Rotaria magnacalcarata]CAF3788587.1 unnamed protein product [Rotaria magnacalcarata]